MITSFTIDPRRLACPTGRGTDPLRPAGAGGGRGTQIASATAAPARRQQDQLPLFTPLLEEVELDGWSSHQPIVSGNFHDWMLVEGGRVLVIVGQAIGPELCDPIEMALCAQAASTAVRAHARHADGAGQILSLAARTVGVSVSRQASVALAVVDSVGGSASLAIAGECLAWRVRAATWEQLACNAPPLGAENHFDYSAHEFAMSLRERILLVADHPLHRPAKFVPTVAADFGRLSAESHRRMTATDALGIIRRRYESAIASDVLASASIVAVRRR